MSSSTHEPSFVLTKLYRKKSEKGTTYFTGRLGGARIALLKSNDTADDGGEIWSLLVSEAAPGRGNGDALRRHDGGAGNHHPPPPAEAQDWQRPDDEILF